MIEQIYERFARIVKEQYTAEEATKIAGMLYVAMQEELGGDIPLGEDFSEFSKDEQLKLWTDAFKICNSYAEAIQYLRTAELEQKDIEEGIIQVDQAQKDELFANFIVIARANPKPIKKPQFTQGNKVRGQKAVQIEINEKDTISMKLHIEKFLKMRMIKIGIGTPSKEYLQKTVTVHLVKEIPNYREFWLFKDQTPDASGITKLKPIFLFGEYMDAVGHTGDDVFVRHFLFEERMTLKNREELLKQLRSTSPN